MARGVGDANRNTMVEHPRSTCVLAGLGTAGVPGAREAFLILGFVLGALFFGIGLLSDLRSVLAPKGGIGMFFGTFNPFHNTHLDDAGAVMRWKNASSDKVIIHPTLIPRLHADAFRKGQIRVGRLRRTASRSTRRRTRPIPTSTTFRPATCSCRPRHARR